MEINCYFDENYQDEKEKKNLLDIDYIWKEKPATENIRKKIFKNACHLRFLLCLVFV